MEYCYYDNNKPPVGWRGYDFKLAAPLTISVQETPDTEEIEPIEITLTPGTGDISVYGNLYYPVFALAILVATNKKNNKN